MTGDPPPDPQVPDPQVRGAQQPGAALTALLDQVHAALLAAQYDRLGPLAIGLEAEMGRLQACRDPATLRLLQSHARRNAASLLAAQRGFRAARRRMDDIRAARSGLVTYDSKGRKAEPLPGGTLARRF